MKKMMRAVVGHRGAYLLAALAYVAAACGVDKAVVSLILAAIYGGMWWMG